MSDDPDARYIADAAAAARAAADAEMALTDAVRDRDAAIREAWPLVQDIGHRAFAARIGVHESVVRAAVRDLARAARERGERVGPHQRLRRRDRPAAP